MKNLSDFTGEEAIELWADLYDQFEEILNDKEIIANATGKNINIQNVAKITIRNHKSALMDIMAKMDANVTGANIFPVVIQILTEMIFGGKASDFFGSSVPESSDGDASGDVTENTEESEK